MVKKGDIVRPLDHSYHVSLLPGGKPVHTSDYGGIYSNDELIVVEIDCHFPVYDHGGNLIPDIPANDTLLWNNTKGYYTFFQSRNLSIVGHVCPRCGKRCT